MHTKTLTALLSALIAPTIALLIGWFVAGLSFDWVVSQAPQHYMGRMYFLCLLLILSIGTYWSVQSIMESRRS